MTKATTKEEFYKNKNVFTDIDGMLISAILSLSEYEVEQLTETVETVRVINGNKLQELTEQITELENKRMLNIKELRESKYLPEPLSKEEIVEKVKSKLNYLSFEEARFYHYFFGVNTDSNQVLVSDDIKQDVMQIYTNQFTFDLYEFNNEQYKKYYQMLCELDTDSVKGVVYDGNYNSTDVNTKLNILLRNSKTDINMHNKEY